MVPANELELFIVSNILCDRKWVGDMTEDEALDCYNAFLKRRQSLAYTFSNDLDRLFLKCNPEMAFKCPKNEVPFVVYATMTGDISIETLTILDRFIGFSKVFDQKISKDDVIWPAWSLKIRKYAPFLEYDKNKFMDILRDKITEYIHGEEQETSPKAFSPEANVA